MSPEFEVLHFKQSQGENLKDAWYWMMESYHKCTLEVNFRILLRNFYVGLNMTHRQLLDYIAKGNFIEIDPSIANEIIVGKWEHYLKREDHILPKKKPKCLERFVK